MEPEIEISSFLVSKENVLHRFSKSKVEFETLTEL